MPPWPRQVRPISLSNPAKEVALRRCGSYGAMRDCLRTACELLLVNCWHGYVGDVSGVVGDGASSDFSSHHLQCTCKDFFIMCSLGDTMSCDGVVHARSVAQW